jgi:hypothetical protein
VHSEQELQNKTEIRTHKKVWLRKPIKGSKTVGRHKLR